MELNRFFKIRLSSRDGSVVYNIDGVTPGLGITAGTLNLEEILCDGELQFGSYNANKLEVQIYGLTEDVSGYRITLYNQPSSTIVPEYIFDGYIDSSITDNKNGYRDIVAYDRMYWVRDLDVGPYWNEFWSSYSSANLRSIREVLCGYAGFDLAVVGTLTNDNLVFTSADGVAGIPAPKITSIKFSTLLKMICEIQGCCPNMTRDGLLTFIPLGKFAPTEVAKNLEPTQNSPGYDKNAANFEDYTTAQPTGFSVYSTSSTLMQIVPNNAATNTNPYPIAGNIFLLSMEASQVNDTLTALVPAIQNIYYVPATIPMILSDLSIQLGDVVSTVRNSVRAYHFVWAQTLSGAQLVDQTFSSPAYGEMLNNSASSENDEIIEGLKFTKIEQDVSGLHIQVGEVGGRVETIEFTIDGITVEGPGGQTLVDGGAIYTDNLYLNRIYARSGSMDSYTEMQDAGISVNLGQSGFIYLGYARPSGTDTKLPYLKLGLNEQSGSLQTGALVKRYPNGIWIGDDVDLERGTVYRGTGLYIDFNQHKLYKYIQGQYYTVADDETLVATFG